MAGETGAAQGAAGLYLTSGVRLLRPEEQVFDAMLAGWRHQQLARNLAFSTIEARERQVRAFARHADSFPWQWSAQLADEWFGDLRGVRHVARSTLRGYQDAVRVFCAYVTDPAYDWPEECIGRFGTHPVQVVHEWNAAVHLQHNEDEGAKRAFTRDELQAFFDHADEQVARKRAAGRKGWLSAFRDSVIFKTAYAYGLRRNETRMLDEADFGRNPDGKEFGEYGVCYVRFGKAKPGSAPKRRSALTVFDWTPDLLEQWFTEARPAYNPGRNPAALHPAEVHAAPKDPEHRHRNPEPAQPAPPTHLDPAPAERRGHGAAGPRPGAADPALRPADQPNPLADPRRRRRRAGDDHPARRSRRPGPRAVRRRAQALPGRTPEPDDRHQPEQHAAVPRPTRRTAWAAKQSEGDWPPPASRSSPAGEPPCGNSSCKPRRRSSPACSATPPNTPKPSPPRPEEPGRPTLPATTAGDRQP